jgi:hypothetical protein
MRGPQRSSISASSSGEISLRMRQKAVTFMQRSLPGTFAFPFYPPPPGNDDKRLIMV